MGNDARQRAWSYQGTQAERLFLLALAEHIPDGKHTCWPAIGTLATMVGASERTTQRMVQSLKAAGAIVADEGRGRGHTTLYGLLVGLPDDLQMQVRQQVKGDTAMSPIEPLKGDISSIKGDTKPDTAMSPFIEEKVTNPAEKVTKHPLKGDTAMSPETRTEIRNEKNTHGAVDRNSFFVAVAEACQIDLNLCTDRQKGQVAQTVKKLAKAGKTPEDVPKVLDYWYTTDWRGKKGDAPRPEQLIEIWQQALTRNGKANGTTYRQHNRGSPQPSAERTVSRAADLDRDL